MFSFLNWDCSWLSTMGYHALHKSHAKWSPTNGSSHHDEALDLPPKKYIKSLERHLVPDVLQTHALSNVKCKMRDSVLQIFIWSKFRQIDTAVTRVAIYFFMDFKLSKWSSNRWEFFCWCTISTLISKPSWWWINFPMVGNKRVGKCPHFSFKLVIYLMNGLLIRIIIGRSIPMAPSPVICQKSNFKIKSNSKFTFLRCGAQNCKLFEFYF